MFSLFLVSMLTDAREINETLKNRLETAELTSPIFLKGNDRCSLPRYSSLGVSLHQNWLSAASDLIYYAKKLQIE